MKTDTPKSTLTMFNDTPDVEPKTLDIKSLSEDDLKSLHINDPFLYYSIPCIRRATIFYQRFDHSDIKALCQGQVTRDILDTDTSHTQKNAVTRCSRISFEADPFALLMEGWLKIEAMDILNNDANVISDELERLLDEEDEGI
mmetsp:Transcript_24405/g.51148  ORF Transcript_24405/g.51148 Transcript_24405/m.51148 type:complete len:143 (+) Transcript_24405:238-666(+)